MKRSKKMKKDKIVIVKIKVSECYYEDGTLSTKGSFDDAHNHDWKGEHPTLEEMSKSVSSECQSWLDDLDIPCTIEIKTEVEVE